MPHELGTTGGTVWSGHTGVAPTTTQTQMIEEQGPGAWQALYNQAMGIPAAGRSAYQNWLASRYGQAATQYSLGQATGGQPGQTFQNWLSPTGGTAVVAGRRDPTSWLGRTALDDFTGYAPGVQRQIMERMPTGGGFNPTQTMLQSRFRTGGVPSWMAQGLTRQALAEAPQYAISPTGYLQTEGEAPSFLGYLFDRYGLGGAGESRSFGIPDYTSATSIAAANLLGREQ